MGSQSFNDNLDVLQLFKGIITFSFVPVPGINNDQSNSRCYHDTKEMDINP